MPYMIELQLPFGADHYEQQIRHRLQSVPQASVATLPSQDDLRFSYADASADRDPAVVACERNAPVVSIRVQGEESEWCGAVACTNYSVVRNVDIIAEGLAIAVLKAVNEGANVVISFAIDDVRSHGVASPLLNKFRKRLRGAALFEQWNIGIGRSADIGSRVDIIARSPMRWLSSPQDGTFTADPFIIHEGDRTIIIYEFLEKDGKGRIHSRVMQHNIEIEDKCILERECHLSYPFILRYQGSVFVIPESSGCRETVAYELNVDSLTLTPAASLFDDLGVVDPTLVLHDGVWYLFGCLAGLAENAALFIWYSSTPFGPWAPHASNPVKLDVFSSRPAGQIIHGQDGSMFRPAQDSSMRYGGSLALNSVTKLSPTEFEEHVQHVVRPSPMWKADRGIHHVSHDGEHFVVDALYDRLSLFQVRQLFHR